MMRIGGKKESDKLPVSTRHTTENKILSKKAAQFPELLQKYHADPGDAALKQLMYKLDVIGSRLTSTFSIYDLREYKELLHNFLKETFGKAYQLKNETGWSQQGKPKLYQSLVLIDQELESLSKFVLSGERERLKILEKLDQIKGLLVDLYS